MEIKPTNSNTHGCGPGGRNKWEADIYEWARSAHSQAHRPVEDNELRMKQYQSVSTDPGHRILNKVIELLGYQFLTYFKRKIKLHTVFISANK